MHTLGKCAPEAHFFEKVCMQYASCVRQVRRVCTCSAQNLQIKDRILFDKNADFTHT